MNWLFVYGSLKEGFPNFHVNKGRRLQGVYRTAEPCALFLFKGQLPCLLRGPVPGLPGGLPVQGQLFEVTPQALDAMDALERVGQPGGYRRELIALERADVTPAARLQAFVYTQDAALLQQPGPHLGPLAEYTLAHAETLRW